MAGHDAAGLARAASVLSAGYLSVLTTALGREFLPRASRNADDASGLHRTLDEQISLMTAVALPVVLTGFVVAPLAIRAVFGPDFGDAWLVLATQLPGDVLKIAGFTLVYGLIASAGARPVVVSEILGGLALLVCILAIVPRVGPVGVGLAATCAYAFYVPLALVLLRRANGYRPSRTVRNGLVRSTALAAAPSVVLATAGPIVALLVTAFLAVASVSSLISTYWTGFPACLCRPARAVALMRATDPRSRS
jgi:O-antigen/teichoic acid export membrane protein